MVAERLREESEALRAEGWRWIETAPDFPYGHTYGLRQLRGQQDPFTGEEEEVTLAALQQEADDIETASAEVGELTDEQDQRIAEIEAAMEAITGKPWVYDADEVARAGAFVSIDSSGSLRIKRGFVRPEDELPIAADPDGEVTAEERVADNDDGSSVHAASFTVSNPAPEPEEDEGIKPLSDRLVTELTAHRTLALRQVLGEQPEVAFLAALHALCLQVFYSYALDSCVELTIKIVGFSSQAPALADSTAAVALGEPHQAWREALPKEAGDLWDALAGFDGDSRSRLFAHCIAQGVNACVELYSRRPRALAHADRLAHAVDLDPVAAGWTPTVDSYLGKVIKTRILLAVEEARGSRAATGIDHLKKGEMAEQAEALLVGSSWLPEPLRTPGRALPEPIEVAIQSADIVDITTVTAASEPEVADDAHPMAAGEEDEAEPIDLEPAHAIAAE